MLGLKLGIIYNRLSSKGESILISRYVSRVEADGGIVEAEGCLKAYFKGYNWAYYYRVIDDGGVVESLECVTI
jgi:hypothetical protein